VPKSSVTATSNFNTILATSIPPTVKAQIPTIKVAPLPSTPTAQLPTTSSAPFAHSSSSTTLPVNPTPEAIKNLSFEKICEYQKLKVKMAQLQNINHKATVRVVTSPAPDTRDKPSTEVIHSDDECTFRQKSVQEKKQNARKIASQDVEELYLKFLGRRVIGLEKQIKIER